ncbi:MAG: hypothetical protein M3R31_04445 [Pseudomonadota bacterium]|nr:hypothetical protein [Pseudomonadota bacterium]
MLQLAIIVLAGRLGNTVAVRIGQAAAVGEIIVGILLGPSLFGVAAPELFHYTFRSSPPEPMSDAVAAGDTMLVIMAIVSTVVTTPGLHQWLPRTGFSPSGR